MRARRAHLPRGQSAHQARGVLGIPHRPRAAAFSRRDLPQRGLHPAEDDEGAGEGRLHAELHLLHLAQHEAGAHRIFHRADADAERAEYMRPNLWPNTPDILPSFLQFGGRPAFLIRAVLAATLSPIYGIYSGFELCENAGPGEEALRRRGRRASVPPPLRQRLQAARQGGVSRLREIPVEGARLERARQHQGRHHAPQPHPPRKPRAPAASQPALSPRRQRPRALLRRR